MERMQFDNFKINDILDVNFTGETKVLLNTVQISAAIGTVEIGHRVNVFGASYIATRIEGDRLIFEEEKFTVTQQLQTFIETYEKQIENLI